MTRTLIVYMTVAAGSHAVGWCGGISIVKGKRFVVGANASRRMCAWPTTWAGHVARWVGSVLEPNCSGYAADLLCCAQDLLRIGMICDCREHLSEEPEYAIPRRGFYSPTYSVRTREALKHAARYNVDSLTSGRKFRERVTFPRKPLPRWSVNLNLSGVTCPMSSVCITWYLCAYLTAF